MRKALIGIAVCGILGLAGAGAAHRTTMAASQQLPVNPPVDAATMASWHAGFGIEFQEMQPAGGTIPPEAAVHAALTHYGAFDSPKYAPNAYLSAVLFGRMTNTEYYTVLPGGARRYPIENRLVWVVTYSGANVPVIAPGGATTASYRSTVNVVVDAMTGEALDMFAISQPLT